uniref:BCNT-C domain-containing protein n=1 Tax=Panagrellus redivivus TaxID=6233 RepID=A0A7E4VJN5_PANRE
MTMLWLLLFICIKHNIATPSNITAQIIFDEKRKITNITLDKQQSELLFQNWHDQAISGLMAAVASAKIRSVSADAAKSHERCAKRARDVIKHAKCVSTLLKITPIKPSTFEESSRNLGDRLKPVKIAANIVSTTQNPKPKLKRVRINLQRPNLHIKPLKLRKRHHFPEASLINFKHQRHFGRVQQIGAFKIFDARKKRFAHYSADSYALQYPRSGITPLGIVAKHLLTKVLDIKNKTISVPWQHSIEKAKSAAIAQKRLREKLKHDEGNYDYVNGEEAKFRGIDSKKVMNSISDLLEDGTPSDKHKMIDEGDAKQSIGQTDRPTTRWPQVMSPRFLSVTEQDANGGGPEDAIDLLSPSLFSLHSHGKGLEKAFSLPNLIKGFTSADQQAWMDLIFEASGVDETIDAAHEALGAVEFQQRRRKRYQEEMVDENGDPLYFTKDSMKEKFGKDYVKKYEIFEDLSKTYSITQQRELNETGYTMMTDQQLELIYGPKSPHNNSILVAEYSNRSKEDLEAELFAEIHKLAEDEAFQRRLKAEATILMPSSGGRVINDGKAVSRPSILSPTIFTVIVGSPITLGPTILSPWFFLPLITSPRTLSPAILTPFAFVPVILSPLVVHPLILCPGFLNPFVLSPLVLAPLILTPQVFTPLILTPLVMSPSILSPTVGSPLVLSPFVLNPVILSPLTLFALVLSPNVLSPVIMSKLFLSELILSPSVLS